MGWTLLLGHWVIWVIREDSKPFEARRDAEPPRYIARWAFRLESLSPKEKRYEATLAVHFH